MLANDKSTKTIDAFFDLFEFLGTDSQFNTKLTPYHLHIKNLCKNVLEEHTLRHFDTLYLDRAYAQGRSKKILEKMNQK
ncbi:MAG: hypothetical protein ABIA74_02970 [bacterium]